MSLCVFGRECCKITQIHLIQPFLHPHLCPKLPSMPSLSFTCVKPSLILLCLKVLANFSSSSRSLGSSEAPAGVRCFATCKCWGTSRWGSTEEPGRPERPTACAEHPKKMLRATEMENHTFFLCHLLSLKEQVEFTSLSGVFLPGRPGWVQAGRGGGCPVAEGRRGGLAAKLRGKTKTKTIWSVNTPRNAGSGKLHLLFLAQNTPISAVRNVSGSELDYEKEKVLPVAF